MKLRILLPMVNILVMYMVVGGAATIIVQAYACADISGQWNVTETANVTCTSTGLITETASGLITMNQSGCNISYIHPQLNVSRSGTVGDNSLQMSGKLALFIPGVTVTENNITITGSIQGENLITFTGQGRASASLDGFTETCTGTTSGTFTRDSSDLIVTGVSVSKNKPITGQAFTINATVKNQGKINTDSTMLRYYHSKDSTITTGDTQLATDAVSALSPGGTSAESELVSIEQTGTFWIGACVDPVSREASTTNNCSNGVEVTVMERVSITPIIQLLLDADE